LALDRELLYHIIVLPKNIDISHAVATMSELSAAPTTLQEDSNDYDDADDNDPYLRMIQFQSIRNSDGLEEAISVQWHENMKYPLRLSTLLQPEDLAPLFAGAQWAGTRVWHASIAAVQYLISNARISSSTRVLELGSGLGVPGILLHALYQCPVTLTDQESILSQLQHNVEHNFTSCNIQARPLSWSKDAIALLLNETKDFDICLNCDCIYEPLYGDSWKQLIECMEELLRRNSHILMVTSVERRTADGIDQFLETLKQSPQVSSVDCVFEDKDYRLEIYVTHGNVMR
jgi:predicted nicotinamide N-methyase